jgi:hypothetical protein
VSSKAATRQLPIKARSKDRDAGGFTVPAPVPVTGPVIDGALLRAREIQPD